MSPSHEEALFSLAPEKPPAKHPSFVDAMCDGDATPRQRLEALLAAHQHPDQALANLSAVLPPMLKVEFPVTPDEAVGQTVGRFKPLDKVGEGAVARCMSPNRLSRCAAAEELNATHEHHRSTGGRLSIEERSVIDELEVLKTELERFGQANDQATGERSKRMLNITRETGEFLAVLVRATTARAVLELGTSNGYSTLWLAEAARATGGHVTTVEISEDKVDLAQVTLARSGLESIISLVHEDAGRVLQRFEASAFDFIFLDSDRLQYPTWWPQLRRVLRPGGLLVVDNAISHTEEMAPFTALVKTDSHFTTSLVPVGNGELLAVKAST